jgi:pimeloyl-ACP methyl ester carboxylesterase
MAGTLTTLLGAAIMAMAVPASAAPRDPSVEKTVILVHGGFVDGSGWAGVHRILAKDGYRVIVVQNPTTSLADDVAVTRRAIASAPGEVVLVGHSYGGVVISEAGSDPKVTALVYIAAFAPDAGESVSSLIANPPAGAAVPPILPPVDGYLFLDRSRFASAFASDVDPDLAQFMEGAVSAPAWRTKPSWYLVAGDDRMIPPPAQRAMANRAGAAVEEIPGSHAVYVANPAPVAALIERAAAGSRAAQPGH